MHHLHTLDTGYNKFNVKFENTVITAQDFGMINENTFYFVGIEGEAGQSKKEQT